MNEQNSELNKEKNQEEINERKKSEFQNLPRLSGLFKEWFLDYASYVILERAVPHVYDGLKPVQRRILHSMKNMDDGRFNKVANIIGHTMQYHPHGDASIGDALVQLGQKNLLVETQGNWGNILTGDNSAAPRYIEARLSKFALEVVFNPKTTFWQKSYDGRNKEPITLPVKFPLLLAQGGEGIAVGLASKILPHNFIELIDASICYLKEEEFDIYPDFPTGGFADCEKYNDGLRGGNVRVRAKIDKTDKKTLTITEIPFSRTTGSLIESILKANDKGKIKIRKIDDNTAQNVEIVIHLPANTSPDKTIDALYAFTDCEISISPNSCVIENDKPQFLGVKEILKSTVHNTVELLKRELQIRKNELNESWHYSSLEKIFIENRIYIEIEDCETYESIIETIDKHLEPFKKLLKREVTREDIIRLTEIKIKRISKYDSFKADEQIKNIEEEIDQINYHLDNLIQYAIDYYQNIKNKYSSGRERKTELRNFDTIIATKVAVANTKLYVNYQEGFIGTSLKKDEYVADCSDIDDVIIFRKDGTYLITKVSEKSFVGKNILHLAIFKPNDERTIYNVIYRDGRIGKHFVKRFAVKGITRDKEYDLTIGTKNSRIIHFSANPNGEAEVVKVFLKPKSKLRRLQLEHDFSETLIKNRNAKGNILTKYEVHKIVVKEKGISTLGGRKIWYDDTVMRLNTEERGKYLGEFSGNEKILIITKSGNYRTTSFELSNHFEDDLLIIEKFSPEKVFSLTYFDADQEYYYLKRFQPEENDKSQSLIGLNPKSKFLSITSEKFPQLIVVFGGKYDERENDNIDVEEFIGVKSFKARGKRISTFTIKNIFWGEALQKEESESESENEDKDVELITKNSEDFSETKEKNSEGINNDSDTQLSFDF